MDLGVAEGIGIAEKHVVHMTNDRRGFHLDVVAIIAKEQWCIVYSSSANLKITVWIIVMRLKKMYILKESVEIEKSFCRIREERKPSGG